LGIDTLQITTFITFVTLNIAEKFGTGSQVQALVNLHDK
jgi:hypothetical protein